jgi:hypothetical protein
LLCKLDGNGLAYSFGSTSDEGVFILEEFHGEVLKKFRSQNLGVRI